MKFAIICLFLALCTIKIFYADANILDKLYADSVNEIGTFVTPWENKILSCFTAAHQQGKDIENCENNFNVPLQDIVPSLQKDMQKCIDDARISNRLKVASECCSAKVNALKSQVHSLVNQAHVCLRKLGFSNCH
ncbi:uncharacterized protein LOC117171888 [Belonocnema kinseyi]|uniref:uncharacterized protein LOC117171888 n=1 Tax=Belonocnema kinseyi TaxID=2817044 RepID=UPI00143D7C54|nr:uncharacterized protein LOC117171888 [Belonocnema kinseyi]